MNNGIHFENRGNKDILWNDFNSKIKRLENPKEV